MASQVPHFGGQDARAAATLGGPEAPGPSAAPSTSGTPGTGSSSGTHAPSKLPRQGPTPRSRAHSSEGGAMTVSRIAKLEELAL